MTEQELRFILSAQDEGLRRGIEAAEQAVQGLDKAVLQLAGSQVKYNTAAGRFVDESNKFIANQRGLNQIGVITSKQLQEQVRLYDELILKFKEDQAVTQQLLLQKQQLQRQYGLLDAAQVQVGRSTRLNSQLYFQAGQAISDFAVAGIRGALNNIEFLAASLGASAPLLIGLSLAGAAFFTFGDDIVRALTPVKARIKEVEGAVGDLLKVISEDQPTLTLLEKNLPDAITNVKAQIIALQAQIRGGFGSAQADPTGLVRSGALDSILGTEEQLGQLGLLRAVLEDLEAQQEDLRVRNEVRDQLARVRGVEEEKQQKDILETKREQLTEAERLTQENASLASVLDSITRGEIDRTEELRIQNRELNQQVEQARRILELRSQVSGSLTGSLALQGLRRAEIGDRQLDFLSARDVAVSIRNTLSTLPGSDVLAQGAGLASENMARIREDAAALIDLNQQLTQSIQSGLTNAFTDLAGAIGEAAASGDGFQNFGTKILQSLGGFAQQFGATLIAFGTAGLAIQSFVTNPIGALIAGGALVALGGALKGVAQRQQENFNASQGAGSAVQPAVTALGINRAQDPVGRGAINPIGARSSRPAVDLNLVPYETVTPSGDVIRGIRAALATDAKKGGSGRL